MLTDSDLLLERSLLTEDSIQRIYKFASGFGLSLVNSPLLHSYPFAWEAAVLKFEGDDWRLIYYTSLTNDVMVFSSDDEANDFIHRAREVLNAL